MTLNSILKNFLLTVVALLIAMLGTTVMHAITSGLSDPFPGEELSNAAFNAAAPHVEAYIGNHPEYLELSADNFEELFGSDFNIDSAGINRDSVLQHSLVANWKTSAPWLEKNSFGKLPVNVIEHDVIEAKRPVVKGFMDSNPLAVYTVMLAHGMGLFLALLFIGRFITERGFVPALLMTVLWLYADWVNDTKDVPMDMIWVYLDLFVTAAMGFLALHLSGMLKRLRS